MKLRLWADGKGGYVTDYPFSKSERYNILPKLIRLGAVKRSRGRYIKIVSHRKVCADLQTQIFTEINIDALENLSSFRGWVISVAERYSLSSNFKIQNGLLKRLDMKYGDWNCERLYRESLSLHVEKFNNSTFVGSVSNEIIANLLGVSPRCVTNWRSEAILANSEGFSSYSSENPSRSKLNSYNSLKTEFSTKGINFYKYVTREMTPHEKVLIKSGELSQDNFFKNENGRWYTKQLVITSDIPVFSIGHCKGLVTQGGIMGTSRKLKTKYKYRKTSRSL